MEGGNQDPSDRPLLPSMTWKGHPSRTACGWVCNIRMQKADDASGTAKLALWISESETSLTSVYAQLCIDVLVPHWVVGHSMHLHALVSKLLKQLLHAFSMYSQASSCTCTDHTGTSRL